MSNFTADDRQSIVDLSYAYAFHCDTGQYLKCAELFTQDAVFDESGLGLPIAPPSGWNFPAPSGA